ncbi:MAG: hypothetical protein AAF518_24515, partial [Spirochaetota bacterium]
DMKSHKSAKERIKEKLELQGMKILSQKRLLSSRKFETEKDTTYRVHYLDPRGNTHIADIKVLQNKQILTLNDKIIPNTQERRKFASTVKINALEIENQMLKEEIAELKRQKS